jgi:hypothetical protein
MQNVHECSKFKFFYSYIVERQKIGRAPFFINFSKETFFDPLHFFSEESYKMKYFYNFSL